VNSKKRVVDRPHKKLEVWKKAINLTALVYRETAKLPESEKFGLISQMRRAAVSVASNIAEGAARQTRKEFIQFLFTAQGSLSELDTQITICRELSFLSDKECRKLSNLIEEEGKMIGGLIRSLRKQ
jgi:four helix bundle protein